MNELGILLGKPNTPLVGLFSTNSNGWIDDVNSEYYPTIDEMISRIKERSNQSEIYFERLSFEFPQSLDDF